MKQTKRRGASICIAIVTMLSVLQFAAPALARPDVPTGLRVTGATSSTVSLSWNDNNDPDVTRYEIYRSETNGTLGPLAGTSTTTTFTDTGLDAGKTYWYYLKAFDGTLGYRSGMVPASTPGIPDGTRLIAFGDMASCNATNKADTLGNLLDVRPGQILALGDLAYPNGSDDDFQNCFEPALGRHKARMLPAVGNHEYYTPNAQGYINYFGSAAGPSDKLYYETWIDGWQVLVLNSNCGEVGGCHVGSAQYNWLQARIAAAPSDVCRIATMHHPRWASYAAYADQAYLSPLYEALYAGGTDLVLTGHAHHYERFAPQNASGQATSDGFQLMIVGTGGVPLRDTSGPASNSAVRVKAFGISELDLRSDSYSWSFLSTSGSVLDSGSRDCVNASTEPPVTTTTIAPTTTTTAAPTTTTTRPATTTTVGSGLGTFEPKPGERDAAGGEVYRLYRAVFLREPDNDGFTYWHTLTSNGLGLDAVASEFAASPEFDSMYGRLDNTGFIRQLYLNVMKREPDQGGWDYWVDVLDDGNARGDVVIWFSQSPEFVRAHPFP